MTWVGLDVHARSTHAAAIDRESGELTRARFGAGAEPVVEWLRELPQPVLACYEAGPTGYALYRAAEAAGLRVDVVAPSKTPRAALAARHRTGPLADGRAASLLPRHRNALGAGAASRGRRLRPLPASRPARGLARPCPLASPVGRERDARFDHQDRPRLRAPHPRRGRLALPARAAHRRHPRKPASRPTRPHPPDRLARPAPALPPAPTTTRTRKT